MPDPVKRLLAARRRLPLWARWLLTLLAYAVAVGVVVLVVRGATSESSSNSRSERIAAVEANEVGKVAVAEDQAAHSAPLAGRAATAPALEAAIAADVRRRIGHGELTGPMQSVHCFPLGPRRQGIRAFRCAVRSAGIAYEFRAIANFTSRRLTWCKVDHAPEGDAALEVPLPSGCTR